ncbi:hypothetical protein [Streptomyces sp. NPDC126933]|uniref:hypothetical protein n=1 Tax=unclassified Streptomyces TaxID=2593676 RepID=UPI00365BB79F
MSIGKLIARRAYRLLSVTAVAAGLTVVAATSAMPASAAPNSSTGSTVAVPAEIRAAMEASAQAKLGTTSAVHLNISATPGPVPGCVGYKSEGYGSSTGGQTLNYTVTVDCSTNAAVAMTTASQGGIYCNQTGTCFPWGNWIGWSYARTFTHTDTWGCGIGNTCGITNHYATASIVYNGQTLSWDI